MKKLLTVALCLILLLSTAACSKLPIGNGAVKPAEAPDPAEENCNITYGKVTKITGNELELNLAENPDLAQLDNDSTGDSAAADSGPDSVAAAPPVPAIGAGDQGGEAPKLELKYTGESKSFVIPAGAQIFDSATGKESKITAIKEGSVLMLYVDKTTGTVKKANIVE